MKTFKYNSKMNELELLKLLTQFIIYNLNQSKNSNEFFKILQKSNIQTVLDKNKNLTFNVKNDRNKLIKSFKIDDLNSPDLTKQSFLERFKDFFERLELLHASSERNPKQAKIRSSKLLKWKDEHGNTYFYLDNDKNNFVFKQFANGQMVCKSDSKSLDLMTKEQVKNGWQSVQVSSNNKEYIKNKIKYWYKHKKTASITDISLSENSSFEGLTLNEFKEALGDRKLNDFEIEHVKKYFLSDQVSEQELKNNFAMSVEKPCAFEASNDPVLNPNEPESTNKKPRMKRNLKLW
ncbi:conserved hypothetical protein [Vibrio nigripulchritudo SFn27]|uniref:hypothetical protein n=2 Tax=Vibrio nigripulchritudo TaxID=28173 RepID=UPI0003B1910A|nr:hypothetical protein [Vibrio nigripulchritudo]CCN89235.1 conserved hypothetical protein [Vibrio nigripulchritudo SFn27]CCO41712.1 conserved hypothetical protein [Vibrio nigripulchritudo SFn135]